MSGQWRDSTRRSRLPADWPAIRRRILTRDSHRCTHTDHDQRCPTTATDVDHVHPGDDHQDSNLTSLCADHHKAKSAAEGVAARAAQRDRGRRPPEPHPGLLTGGERP